MSVLVSRSQIFSHHVRHDEFAGKWMDGSDELKQHFKTGPVSKEKGMIDVIAVNDTSEPSIIHQSTVFH